MSSYQAPKILMFDSGVGGLSVMQEVYKANKQALFYYLFDHECFPYGNKSEVFLKKRVSNLLQSLCSKLQPDLIVIACNTASTIVLPTLREIFTIPIVGVVPAIKPAAKISKKHNICLLATQGTVHRSYTDFLINEFASDCKVLKIGSQDLVRLAEEQLIKNSQGSVPTNGNTSANAASGNANSVATGCANGSSDGCAVGTANSCASLDDYERDKLERLKKILEPILQLDEANKPDVVVLGCTHFPLVKDDIAKVLGPNMKFIDSGEAVARRVKSLLADKIGSKNESCEPTSVESPIEGSPLSLSDGSLLGPVEAFYTGHCEGIEKKQLEATFKHFGFQKISAFLPNNLQL